MVAFCSKWLDIILIQETWVKLHSVWIVSILLTASFFCGDHCYCVMFIFILIPYHASDWISILSYSYDLILNVLLHTSINMWLLLMKNKLNSDYIIHKNIYHNGKHWTQSKIGVTNIEKETLISFKESKMTFPWFYYNKQKYAIFRFLSVISALFIWNRSLKIAWQKTHYLSAERVL